MKALKKIVVVLAIAASGCSEPPPNNKEVFTFFATGATVEQSGEAFNHLLRHGLIAGDVLHVLHGSDHELVATVVIPEASSANVRLRDPEVRSQLAEIRTVFESGSAPPRIRVTSSDGRSVPLHSAPSLGMTKAAATVRNFRQTTFPVRVIFVGSPVFNDVPAWSFEGGLVPSDNSLTAKHSPFHHGGKFPADTKVRWLTQNEWGVDQDHRDAVTRFLHLYFRSHGSELERLTPSASIAFGMEPSTTPPPVFSKRNDPAGMIEATRNAVREAPTPINAFRVPVIQDPPVSPPTPPAPVELVIEEPPQSPPLVPPPVDPTGPEPQALEQSVQEMEFDSEKTIIGIEWFSTDPKADLDLHIQDVQFPGRRLYFNRAETPFGRLLRDERRSRKAVGGDDQILTWEAAVINHNRLRDLSLKVHSYAAAAPSHVRIIVVWKGVWREYELEIPPSSGTSDDWTYVPWGNHWTIVE